MSWRGTRACGRCFQTPDGVPVQVVEAARPVPLQPVAVRASELGEALTRAAAQPFDLGREGPLRVQLLAVGPDDHVLLLVLHHIASDGWSAGPLWRDLTTAYAARRRGEAPGWAPLPVQYVDYTLWQRAALGDEREAASPLAQQLAYWQRTLADLPTAVPLPTDGSAAARRAARERGCPLRVAPATHAQLLAVGRQAQATIFMVVQAALAALLTRLGAGTDLPFGTPTAGRTDAALEDLVGFFVNTLVLRVDTAGQPTFETLVARVRETALGAYAHADVPFERLVELLQPTRSLARHPLFQVLLTVDPAPGPVPPLPALETTAASLPVIASKFDLTFSFREHRSGDNAPEGVFGAIEYRCDLFDRSTVEAMAERLTRMLDVIARDATLPLHRLDVLTPGERLKILSDWHAVPGEPESHTVPDLFESQVRLTPDAVALECADEWLTYSALDCCANQLANLLLEYGAAPERAIVIAMSRSRDALIAIIAVLKTGAAYVPLDVSHPRAWNRTIVSDVEPVCVITTDEHADLGAGWPVVSLVDHATRIRIAAQPKHSPADGTCRALTPAHAAYMM